MKKYLVYVAPIALIGLAATEEPAAPVTWSGMGRDITAIAPDGTGAPLVLARGGRGGGGG